MNKRIAFLLSLCWIVCCSYAQNSFSKQEVRQSMRRVADWQIAHMKEVTYDPLNWVNATFYLGLSKWASVAEQENQDDFYFKWLRRLGARNYWQVDKRMYHADDICVAQTYLDLYRKYGKEEMLIPTKARAEWVMAHPSKGSFLLDYGMLPLWKNGRGVMLYLWLRRFMLVCITLPVIRNFSVLWIRSIKRLMSSFMIRMPICFIEIIATLLKKKPMARRCFGAEETDGCWEDWSKFFVNFL